MGFLRRGPSLSIVCDRSWGHLLNLISINIIVVTRGILIGLLLSLYAINWSLIIKGYGGVGTHRIPMILFLINDVAKHHLQVIFIFERLLLELANIGNFLKHVTRMEIRIFF